MKPLNEQVIVITGGSSGIGLATALLAAEEGARLVLGSRNGDILTEICEHIIRKGGAAVCSAGDVGDRAFVELLSGLALDRFGRIDTWVNNAGVSIYGRLTEVTEEDHRRLFETNFWGVVHGSLVAIPHLMKSRGTLINVGSEVSDAVVPLQGMYAASKHAVKGFTDSLRVELKHDEVPVTVTLIQPGATDTPFPQHARNYMDREPALPTPLDDPQDVAEAILEAATEGKRQVRVSAPAKLNSFLARVAPRLGDRMAVRQMDRQQYSEPPRDPLGTLYTPGSEGRVYGTGGPRAG